MSNVTTCYLSPTFLSFDDISRYLTYTICPPIFFALGLAGHAAALVAFANQSRTESAYAYQVFVTVVKTLDILTFNIFVLFMFQFADQNWTGQKGDNGWTWFKSQFVLMWFTGHVAPVLESAFITVPILASAAMAVDRVVGLSRPVAYKVMNKKRHHLAAFLISSVLGLLSGVDTGWRWTIIIRPDGVYKLVSTSFGKTTGGVVASQLRNAVRFLAELVLVVSSVTIIVLYKKRLQKVKTMILGPKNDRKEQELKAQQTALVVLTLFQCCSTMAGTIYLAAYSYASYFSPTFASCQGSIFSTLFDFVLQLVNALDFYLLFAISRPFRVVIRKNLKSGNSTNAQPQPTPMNEN